MQLSILVLCLCNIIKDDFKVNKCVLLGILFYLKIKVKNLPNIYMCFVMIFTLHTRI